MKRKVETLICACCGYETLGKQWWNQDTGYGLCAQCGKWLRDRGDPDIAESYGTRGIHYDINAKGKENEIYE